MPELPQLTLAFLQQRPASAARAIEALAPEDAAELICRVPVRIAEPVFEAMNSVAAARCVERLPADNAAAICAALPWADASALLRQLAPDHRQDVLGKLSTSLAVRFRRSLDYAASAVGAWTEMDVPVIVADRTVGEAVRLLARVPRYSASHLLLTDLAQKYVGIVPLAALLQADSAQVLEVLAVRECRALRDSTPIAAVSEIGEWEMTSLLPVVNHRGELLGGLSRATLNSALRGLDAPPAVAGDSLLAHLMGAYFVAGEGLLRLLVDTPTASREDHGGGLP